MSPWLYALFGAWFWISGLQAGLWWGERRRREDAQIREGKVPVARSKAKSKRVRIEDGMSPEEIALRREERIRKKERLIEDAIQQDGLSRAQAEADAEAMLLELERMGVQV